MTSLCYNSKRVELDCGTGAGGFKAGNTCAKGGEASPDVLGQKLVEKIKRQNPKADVAKEAVRMGVNAVVKAVRGAKIAGQYGASKTADIVRWLGSESGKSFVSAVGRTLKITGVGAIGALRGLNQDRFKILGTAIFAPQFVPFYAGASAFKGFFNGAIEEYNSEGSGRQISNAIRRSIGRPEFEAKTEDPKLEDVVAYLSDVLAVSIRDYIEGKEQFEITTFAEDTCPLPTQDIKVNLANRQKAIDTANYGPANPKEPNEEYWAKKAKIFGGSVKEAKTMLCGNCAGFNKTSKLLGCISKGIGTDAKEVEQAGDLGYCEIFDFKCASLRTCDAWIVGGPIQDKKELSDNCGTGSGGFKEGNTCASKNGNDAKSQSKVISRWDSLPKKNEKAGTPKGGVIENDFVLYHETTIDNAKSIKNNGFKKLPTASAGWFTLTDSYSGAEEYSGKDPSREIIKIKIPISEVDKYLWPNAGSSDTYGNQYAIRKDIPSKMIESAKKDFSFREFADNCGTGSGGFKEGNTCAKGSQSGGIFISPSTEENQDFKSAKAKIDSGEQARAVSLSKDIIKDQGMKGDFRSAIGDWEDGAENAIKIEVQDAQDYDQIAYTAAKLGSMFKQKAVIAFQNKNDGEDSIYKISAPKGMDDMRKILSDNGIKFRTIFEDRGKSNVTIFDKGSELLSKVNNVMEVANATGQIIKGVGEFIGGDTRIQGEQAYRKVISDYETKFPTRTRHRFSAGIGLHYNGSAYQLENCGTGSGGFKEGNTCSKGAGGGAYKNEKVSNSVMSSLETLKKHAREKTSEKRIAIDAESGEIIGEAEGSPEWSRDKETDPSISGVEGFTPEQTKKWIDTKEVIEIHTHPDESSFSPEDWGTFAFSNVKEMLVVTPKGDTYKINKTDKFDRLPIPQKTPAYIKNSWEKLSDRDLRGKPLEQSIFEINKELAGKLGIKIETTKNFETNFASDCGTGAGGFKEGNTCAKGGGAGTTMTPSWARENPEKASKETANTTTLFHGTSVDVLKSIKEKGLLPSKSGVWGGGKVYSTDSLDLAMEYGVLRATGAKAKIAGRTMIGIVSVLAEGFQSVADNIPTVKAQKMGKTGLAAVSKIFTKDGAVSPKSIRKIDIFDVDSIRKYVYENGPKPKALATKELEDGKKYIYVPIVIEVPEGEEDEFELGQIQFYNPDQARDNSGKWTDSGDQRFISSSKIFKNKDERFPNYRQEEPEIVEVPANKLIPTQPKIDPLTLKNYKQGGEKFKKDEPKVVKRGDSYIITDGHHRIASQILNGIKSIRAKKIGTFINKIPKMLPIGQKDEEDLAYATGGVGTPAGTIPTAVIQGQGKERDLSAYTKPKLRERIKNRILRGTKGGKAGQWSARKAQLLVQAYEKAGGGYKGGKTKGQSSLKKWTKEKWRTSDNSKSIQRGKKTKRYLPSKVWDKLSPAEKAVANRTKAQGSKKGKQFVPNPPSVTKKFSYNGKAIELNCGTGAGGFKEGNTCGKGGGGKGGGKAGGKGSKDKSDKNQEELLKEIDAEIERLENEPKAKEAVRKMRELRDEVAKAEGIDPEFAEATRWSLRDPSRYIQDRDIKKTFENPTPEHRKWIESIKASELNPNAKSENPVAVILMGSPASGKTTTGRPFAQKILGNRETTKIDPDAIKAKSKGFEGWNAGAFHEESSILAEKVIFPQAIAERHNILLDITGKNSDKVATMAKTLKGFGYTIGLVHVDVDDKTALKRASTRFNKPNGRWVPYRYIKGSAQNARNTWSKLTKEGIADIGYSIDGNAERVQGRDAPIRETYGKIAE